MFHARTEVCRRHPGNQTVVGVSGVGGRGGMDGNRFLAGGCRHATSAVLPLSAAWPLDSGTAFCGPRWRHCGLLCPLSLRALGWPRFRPASLASRWASEEAFSRTFCGVHGLCRAPAFPISGLIINFLLGLSPVRHRHFVLGTAFGILPQAVPFTLVASGTLKLTGRNTPLYIGIALGILLLICASLSGIFPATQNWLSELRSETQTVDGESGSSSLDPS